MVKTRSRLVNTVRRCAFTQKLYLLPSWVRVQSPGAQLQRALAGGRFEHCAHQAVSQARAADDGTGGAKLRLSPSWERGSVSVQAKPAPEALVGVAPLVVRRASTVMAKPPTAAQLSLTGRMLVWMKRPPDCEKMSTRHQYLMLGGHTHRAGAEGESALSLMSEPPGAMKVGGLSSCT